jgi:uridine phosphorylase
LGGGQGVNGAPQADLDGRAIPARTSLALAAAALAQDILAQPVVAEIRNACRNTKHRFQEGPVWSTDAIFRETRDKVRHYQDQGVLAVEMELSALFTVGKYRGVEVGGILVVSDELTTLTWRPGFKDERFEKGRVAACEAVKQICLKK